MNESIANRVGRLITGSVNAIVDAMENSAPETVMKEAIREVEGAIEAVRAELGKEIAGIHLARQRLDKERQKLKELNKQAELAVTQGRDDLAQAGIEPGIARFRVQGTAHQANLAVKYNLCRCITIHQKCAPRNI